MSVNATGVLSSKKVLDLTDIKGMFCGKFLASLGAEVIKVEKPGGDKERFMPPFVDNKPGVENSLMYHSYNTNKESITLDIETETGKEIFKRLVKESDFVIESFTPGYMDSLGLGYADLEAINPGIIMTSVSPFGQTGPYAKFKATDLTIMAMSGLMYLIGERKGTPLRLSVPQAYALGGAEAFCGTMFAHYYREKTGIGQQVDVCIRDAFIKTTINIMQVYESTGRISERAGVYWAIRARPNRMLWPCKDGHVTFRLHGGAFAANTNKALVKWMDENGCSTDYLNNFDWEGLDLDEVGPEVYEQFEGPVGEFFKRFTREELRVGCLERNIMLLPVCTIDEVAENPQPKSRDFWQDVEVPAWGRTVKFPGAYLKATATPPVPVKAMATLGSFNEEVYINRLGFTAEDLKVLAGAKVI